MDAPNASRQAQAPLPSSGTDYSGLVQGSTDPTDKTLVIRQVIPGMLTFSLPFVCPIYVQYDKDTDESEPWYSPHRRTIDCDSLDSVDRERDLCLRLFARFAIYQVCYREAIFGGWTWIGRRTGQVDRSSRWGAWDVHLRLAEGFPQCQVNPSLSRTSLKAR